jgi:hypothetical protein
MVLIAGVNAADEFLVKIVIEAGKYDRIDTPVSLTLDVPVLATLNRIVTDSNQPRLKLVEITDSRREDIPSQIEPGNPARLWWILKGTTPAGSKREYELAPRKVDIIPDSAIRLYTEYHEVNDPVLQIHYARRGKVMGGMFPLNCPVLRYNPRVVPAPEGKSKLYDRGAFIHPLWSPRGKVPKVGVPLTEGNVLTDIHPADHIHHFGIWMAWTETEFEGSKVDFWNLNKGEGTVRFVKLLSTMSGSVYGGFQSEHDHVALKTAQGEKVVLKEVWDVRVYNVGGPEKGYWLIDFKSTQRCASSSPLKQLEYRYGGLGFRGPPQWKGPNSAYLTSEGKNRENGHGTRARWCDMSGCIDLQWEGLTMMSHPGNFRHPEPMRIWLEPDNYIFFNFAPSQAGDWVMEPGQDYIFQYRLYVHEGKVNVEDIERVWHDYAEPPTVSIDSVIPPAQ